MVVACAMCKKQPIPYDRTRSFHRFPNKPDLRQKWMDVVGVTSVKKTWAVCSDHFASTSFHEENGYNNSKRRLLPNAVPENISTVLSHITNDNFEDGMQEDCEESETHYSVNRSLLEEESNISFSDSVNGQSVNESSAIGEIQPEKPNFSKTVIEQSIAASDISDTEEENATSNLKRTRLDNDEKRTGIKKIRFKHGYAIHCISRADFVSDESWNTFLIYSTSMSNKLKADRKKVLRREKEIVSCKEFLKSLINENHLSVTQ